MVYSCDVVFEVDRKEDSVFLSQYSSWLCEGNTLYLLPIIMHCLSAITDLESVLLGQFEGIRSRFLLPVIFDVTSGLTVERCWLLASGWTFTFNTGSPPRLCDYPHDIRTVGKVLSEVISLLLRELGEIRLKCVRSGNKVIWPLSNRDRVMNARTRKDFIV